MSVRILACVDHSNYADYVTDYSSWAASKLEKKLELIHILDCSSDSSAQRSRNCEKGYDIQSVLMNSFQNRDEKQIEMLKEKGTALLQNLKSRAEAKGISDIDTTQMTGTLIGALVEKQHDASMLVVGRKGKSADPAQNDPIRNLEYVIKSVNIPVLTVPNDFKTPKKIMITYDGSTTSKNNIRKIIDTGLLKDMSVYLLMCGNSNTDRLLEWAHDALIEAGLDVSSAFIPGNSHIIIPKEIRRLGIDMIAIGGYTSSPLVRLVVGSKTNELLRILNIPVLVIK